MFYVAAIFTFTIFVIPQQKELLLLTPADIK